MAAATIGLRILDREGREVFGRQKANRRWGARTASGAEYYLNPPIDEPTDRA
jgi:hypothetical protein